MVVSIITVKLHAPWVHSLKTKRAVAKSLMSRLSHKFNVSVIESDAQDIHQTIVLSIAFLAANQGLADRMDETICNFIEANTDAEVLECQVERR
jgi:uncharacterized protein YlxP (DUF503 family)